MVDVEPTIDPSVPTQCDRYYTEGNRTSIIYGGYEGIPENLLINVIVWLVLLLSFSALRKLTQNYGRSESGSSTEARSLLHPDESRYNVLASLFHGQPDETRSCQDSLDIQDSKEDTGFCSWIPAYFSIKDKDILEKRGPDAVQYLIFQRYLLVYMACVTALSIVVILPVNFQGDLEGDTKAFGHTTISNIKPGSPTLWVHSVFSVVFLVIAVLFMRHFSAHLQYVKDEQATRTLMISNITKDKCSRNIINQHFQEAYPEAPVQDIQLAHNISKLIEMDKKRQRASECLINSEAIMRQQGGERPTMVPYPCGHLCACCCPGKQVDAIDHYTQEEAKYKEKYEQEKINAYQDKLGIAFVTFEDDQVAARVYSDFEVSCKGAQNPYPSSVSRELGVHNWEVKFAAAPDNINWENLSSSLAWWRCKAISINLGVFIILFFLTTPSIILNLISQTNLEKSVHNPILVQFLPTLILLGTSALLPLLVYQSVQWIGHWSRSAEHHAVMRKCFIFLLMMVLVLPSLGLTSASALIGWFTARDEEAYKFRWECIFIPDNGAFFVNYVITSAFIGTALELICFPELIMYSMKILFARSGAECTSAQKSVLQEFQFGSQYAWILCVFSVVMAYSIVCPLITPFGLVYLLMKHIVDRYNIYFAYAPSKIDQKIHASAITFVIVAVILLQCTVVFFNILRTDEVIGTTMFSVVALLLTLFIFIGRVCCGFNLITYKIGGPGRPASNGYTTYSESDLPGVRMPADTEPFIPTVLQSEGREPEREEGVVNHMAAATYGSTDPPNTAAHEQV